MKKRGRLEGSMTIIPISLKGENNALVGKSSDLLVSSAKVQHEPWFYFLRLRCVVRERSFLKLPCKKKKLQWRYALETCWIKARWNKLVKIWAKNGATTGSREIFHIN